MSNIKIRKGNKVLLQAFIEYPFGNIEGMELYPEINYKLVSKKRTYTTPVINNHITFINVRLWRTEAKNDFTKSFLIPSEPYEGKDTVYFITHDTDIVVANSKKAIRKWWKNYFGKSSCCKLVS